MTKLLSYIGGELNHASIDEILQKVSKLIDEKKYPATFARKIYSIASECLENIASYSIFPKGNEECVVFEIEQYQNGLKINSKNYLKSSDVKELEKRIVEVNSLKPKDLKPHFIGAVKGNNESKKGGAGLGLIMMKRKSENPINYKVTSISKGIVEIDISLLVSIDNMKTFRREETKHTPFVQFDLKSGKFELAGLSRPENADEFYIDAIQWINEQKQVIQSLSNPNLSVDLEYFNSSSLKNIVRLLRTISEIASDALTVSWYYDKEDESAKEEAVEISEIIKKDFTFIEKN